jgi:hypothetical protein
MVAKKQPQAPKSRTALIRIMEENGQAVITWKQADRAGACDIGLRTFQAAHFPRRRQLRLHELVPFIRYHHEYWDDVVKVVWNIMHERGLLVEDYHDRGYWLGHPGKYLPDRYYMD